MQGTFPTTTTTSSVQRISKDLDNASSGGFGSDQETHGAVSASYLSDEEEEQTLLLRRTRIHPDSMVTGAVLPSLAVDAAADLPVPYLHPSCYLHL